AQTKIRTEDIEAVLHAELGTHARHYPVYSSKTVNGKPLFLHALEGAIDTIQIPTHPETIYKISLQSVENIPGAALKERVNKTLANAPTSAEPSKALGADFRIGVVRKGWEIALTDDMYTVLRISVVCGTGTYMRTLVDRIGKSLGSRGLALSIHRTKIGKYFRISDTLGFFWKRYR
ncbi:hypothetical protein KKH15_02555, partial [Patescibacteria group bacterium]|nr:hypothetical protein [Patescibacteria group bacterium]MBU1754729.1 hypothetical protein [Patescibacteria group bacterium]